MHTFFWNRLGLLDEASETESVTASGGAPVSTPPAAKPPEAGAAATAVQPPAVAKPGMIDQAIAMFKDKGAMAGEITTLKAQVTTLTTERDAAQTQLATVVAERDGLRGEMTRLQTALDGAMQSATTVQNEVVTQLAAAGVPEARLPKGPGGAVVQDGSIEDAIAAMNGEKDPGRKGMLAAKVAKLREQQAKMGSN